MENRQEAIEDLFSDGAICIGENHSETSARDALIKMIQQGNVKKLFLEIPACSKEVQKYLADPDKKINSNSPKYVKDYINGLIHCAGDNQKIPWRKIIAFAKENGVAVYCHDLPVVDYCSLEKDGKISYLCDVGIVTENSYMVDPQKYFNQLLNNTEINSKRSTTHLKNIRSKTAGVAIRNQYSAEVIKSCTHDFLPTSMNGVVIFGGADHFSATYGENSLNKLCHISEERILNYSSTVENKRMANQVPPLNSPFIFSSPSSTQEIKTTKNDRAIHKKRKSGAL